MSEQDQKLDLRGGGGETGASAVPDSHGIDRFADDAAIHSLLPLYLSAELLEHLRPVLADLGPRLGGELDSLAQTADVHPPRLAQRTRRGEDVQRVETHPAYQRLQKVAFEELGMAAMSHRGGVLGWPEPLPPVVKYLFFYLFVQAEFGLACPVSMTDALTRTLRRFGDAELVRRHLDGLTSTDMDTLTQGAMFMTEQQAGSDVGRTATAARDNGDGTWALTGEKWFCSNVDAELTMVLARPEGAGEGIRNLSLFLLPRTLPDGSANSYRIVRLKDKLGTRSMPSGEVSLRGATAYLVGQSGQGFKQMADMVNASRLSNGVRAAGLMRRAFGEARYVCTHREAFGRTLIDLPLQRRQLAKLLLPTEQALSVWLHTAKVYAQADSGDRTAAKLLRLLTPLVKFRACRDVRKVTADAMEVRGGVGYIEEFGDARVFRDAQLGSIWEGTSNIIALDVARAATRAGCLDPLMDYCSRLISTVDAHPRLQKVLADRQESVHRLARGLQDPERESEHRRIATVLYDFVSAVFLAWEGAQLSRADGDHGRLLLAAMVVRHRLSDSSPFDTLTEPSDLLGDLVRQERIGQDALETYCDALDASRNG